MDLAHRKRQLVRDELAEAALKLLAIRDFEDTTIDQIAAAAGVSRRTFFRYFPSKEDVIVESLAMVGQNLRAAFEARPAGLRPATALRQTFCLFEQACTEHPEKVLRLTRLILHTPALHARYLERQAKWKTTLAETLAETLARREKSSRPDMRAVVAVGVAFAALDAALREWVAGDGKRDMAELLDETFALAFPR